MDAVGALSSGVLQTLQGASPPLLVLALFLHLLKVFAEARSWHGVLANAGVGAHAPFRRTLRMHVGANGPNALLPARLGEALRVGIARRCVPDMSAVTIAGTVVFVALLELAFAAAVLGVVLLGGLAFGARVPALRTSELTALVGAAAVCVLVACLAFRCRGRVGGLARRLGGGFSVVERPSALGAVLGWKFAACALRIAAVATFLLAFHLPSSLWLALTVIAAQSASAALPFMPGNIGTQQAALTVALTSATVASPAQALGFGVGMQAATIAVDIVASSAALILLTDPQTMIARVCEWTTALGARRAQGNAATATWDVRQI